MRSIGHRGFEKDFDIWCICQVLVMHDENVLVSHTRRPTMVDRIVSELVIVDYYLVRIL
jgi:hypothetical protein